MEDIINMVNEKEINEEELVDMLYDIYLYTGICKGLDDAENGRVMTLDEAKERMRKKYENFND